MVYMLLITSSKLVHYFQSHRIEVHISSTFGEVLHNKDTTCGVAEWVIELGVYDIVFKPCSVVTTQALGGFVAEWTEILI